MKSFTAKNMMKIQNEIFKFHMNNIKEMQKLGYDISDQKPTEWKEECSSYHNMDGTGGFSPCTRLQIMMMNKYAEYENAPCIARPIVRVFKGWKTEKVKFKYCPFCGFFFDSKVRY